MSVCLREGVRVSERVHMCERVCMRECMRQCVSVCVCARERESLTSRITSFLKYFPSYALAVSVAWLKHSFGHYNNDGKIYFKGHVGLCF